LTLIQKLQHVHFIHMVSELDCVTTFYLRIDQMIATFFYHYRDERLTDKIDSVVTARPL
jgi:hypothetical protein